MIDRLANWLYQPTNLFRAGVVLFVWGFLTIPASGMAGVASINLTSGKEVGYLSAVNWWPNYTVILPALVFGLAWLGSMIQRTHGDLCSGNMVVRPNNVKEILSETDINSAWFRAFRMAVHYWILFATIVVIYSGWECWDNSISPILSGDISGRESDWAVGAILLPEKVSQISNIIFSVFVFALQAFGVSLALLLLVLSISYANFLISHSYDNADFCLIPNRNSDDPRRGFETFEDIGTLVLGNALFAYLALYLVILRNEYLRHSALTIWDMPFGPFSMFTHINNFSNVVALMLGMVLILAIVVLLPCVALSYSAARAKQNFLTLNEITSSPTTDAMVWWPFQWLRLNLLLTAIAVASLSLFVPSVAPYLIGVFCTSLVGYLALRINRLFRKGR